MVHQQILSKLDLNQYLSPTGSIRVHSPIDGKEIAQLNETPLAGIDGIIAQAHKAFLEWRLVPAPKRGELVRLFGDILRTHKEDLSMLVTLESGKILEEGRGEVQEMIDMCDFAVGLSRQLYGLTIASERPGHRMMETWHPLGVVGVITPFNFPAAVWAWNACLALICGNTLVWKPSSKTPLTALACHNFLNQAIKQYGVAPTPLQQLVIGSEAVGEKLVNSPLIPLMSATGSTRMGQVVGPKVAARFGQTILELGGNNAMIVAPTADLNLTLQAILFSAVGTAGQRCTSLRRLFIHESLYDTLVKELKKRYQNLAVGNPLEKGNLVGPLIDATSYQAMQSALTQARQEGGTIQGGERLHEDIYPNAYYVRPAIVEMPKHTPMVCSETFAPILYVMKYTDFDKVLALHNEVVQGLSSCIFTNDVREAEIFLSARGSDCGIANVNIGPSGAEIGGAFGGNKETGGGRESGSDSWKAYMRRATNTINYSKSLPLAQGIKFDV
ncbi:MAG: aldehyde dehydrogenase family protein [Alphaproteobacteria bacterium]|jgi:aldehyde dehydrogenase (NAD+)|nr:aldehyde dehydrogenase family protein [Alphaproteobacteria bacterium]